MMRMTSMRVREVVDKVSLPAAVRLSRSFWVDVRNDTVAERLTHIFAQLPTMTTRHHITRLELPRCEMKGQESQDVVSLIRVLAQCPALAHLDLSGNCKFKTEGVRRIAGVCYSLLDSAQL